jgi:hypothetical protein
VNGVVSLQVTFWLAAGAALPTLLMSLVVNQHRASDSAATLRDRLRPGHHERALGQPVERLAADLHRLAVHLDTVERSHEMHRVERLRAAVLAYDDTLRSACRTLDVEVPDSSPLPPFVRLQTEAALAQRGLVW